MVTGKIIYIDIDETICESPDAPDYTSSKPIVQNIDKANQLYDQGNTIIYWTARGSLSNQNLLKFTYNQLKSWGVKFHKLKSNKPYYDMFIDDKNINVRDWE